MKHPVARVSQHQLSFLFGMVRCVNSKKLLDHLSLGLGLQLSWGMFAFSECSC